MSENAIVLIVFIAIIVGTTLLFQKIINSIRTKPLKTTKNILSSEIAELEKTLDNKKEEYNSLDNETKSLQKLKENSENISNELKNKQHQLADVLNKIDSLKDKEKEADEAIHTIRSKMDLYSRLDDFVDYGIYEMPKYLYETSERYAIEIKKVREQ